MQKYNKFYFKSFEFNQDSLKASFHYSFDNDEFFEEVIDFHSEIWELRGDLDAEIIDNILFHIHIALWISYYKLCPTNELVVESWILDDYQVKFWKKFYINWLWEFLYTNKISPEWLFDFKINTEKKYIKKEFDIKDKYLVPVWWWKDSIVSIELLKNKNLDLCVFWTNDELKSDTAKIAWRQIVLIKRKLSENLFKLNNKWYYNWHVPITWLIAFVLELVMYLYNYKYTILSNERSANYWNTTWKWLTINHQYSKSLEFEKDFWEYVWIYISNKIKYFSLLRWLYETKIAEKFSSVGKKYFSSFSSCNWNFKILNKLSYIKSQKRWCNTCPKCIFVFTILRPYITKKEVLEIFWEDLFERKDLEKIFKELLWISWIKPLECVWESEEMIYSMYLSIRDHYKTLPYILEIFKKEVLNKLKEADINKIEKKLDRIYEDDIIPSEIKQIVI
jgi:UDP-N-acetyl-alpha-D-muramoyl-L-alanyl-L-glutamate epimerase